MVERVFEHGQPFFIVPAAGREFVELTRVEEWPRPAPARRIELTHVERRARQLPGPLDLTDRW